MMLRTPRLRLRHASAAVWLLAAAAGTHAASPSTSPAPPGLLRRIHDVRQLPREQAAKGYEVRLTGVVTYFDATTGRGTIIHDGHEGQFIVLDQSATRTLDGRALEPGDVVTVEGHTARGGFAPNVRGERVERLGRGRLPVPEHVSYARLLTGRHDCDYVEIAGVVQRAWKADPAGATLFLDVAVEGGTVRASFSSFSPQDVERFIDARVRLRGNAGTLFGQAGQLRGVSLLAGRTADVIVEEPPTDPFSIPTREAASLYRYASSDDTSRRIRVRGVVTYQRKGQAGEISDFTAETTFRVVRHVLYLQDSTSGLRIETEQDPAVQPGDMVEVVGFPIVTPTKPYLGNAVFKRLGASAALAPKALPTREVLAPEHDAELVRLEAQLLGAVKSTTELVLVLKVGETAFDASMDAGLASPEIEAIRAGSRVAVSGVYTYQWGPPPAFRILLRSPSDVVVIAAASWWTFGHTLVLMIFIALTAAAAGVWVRAVVNRHALARQHYQAILAERSRLARELHDTLEQGLAGIKLQLEAVAGSLDGSSSAARRSLDVAREMLLYALNEARRSVLDLRSQALESRDLPGALRDLAQQMTQGTPLKATVSVLGAAQRLDASQEHHLLRIGLEALTNAIKYSDAQRVDIELRFGEQTVELVVRDNGRGFAVADGAPPIGHFGLRGIRERVDKMGGTLRLSSQPGLGAEIAVGISIRVAASVEGERTRKGNHG
jgi:signal transduction histidine kinase